MRQALPDSGRLHHGSSTTTTNNGGRSKCPHMVVPSSSKSSSYSYSSPFTSTTVPQTPGRTMEEVWKEIALGTATPLLDGGGRHSPYYHNDSVAACHSSITSGDLPHLRGTILQDFLASPFSGQGAAAPSVQPALQERGHHGDTRLPAEPHRPSPATVLSLNTGRDFQYMDATPLGAPPLPPAVSPGSSFPGIFPFCSNKKRASELLQQQQQLDGSEIAGGDRRNKRMIKNRESAARSRARKQAYTNELELEVNHLTEENERLRRQHEELRATMAAQLTRKKALQRSSTAPF